MENKKYKKSDVKNVATKAKGLYELITKDFVFTNITDAGEKDIEGNYVSGILLPILTGIVNGKQLIFGNPGNGKTTTAELVSSLLYSFPINAIISDAEIHGHPEITAEDIFGSLDLPEMKSMNWSGIAQFPYVKIIDEINRLSGKQQDMILNLVDRGVSKYLNHTLVTKKAALYATANYEDMGNTEMILPLKDRFDVSTEMHHLGPLERIILIGGGNDRSTLENDDLSYEIGKVMNEKSPYNDKLEKLEQISSRFRESLNDELRGVTISHDDLNSTRDYINNIPFSEDGRLFLAVLHSELARPDGIERIPGDRRADTGHYANTNYAFNKINNDVSNRFTQSLILYSRAYSWFLGDEAIEPKHISTMLPYTLAHRVSFADMSKAGQPRLSNLGYAKQISEGIINRYDMHPEMYKEAYQTFLSYVNKKDSAGEFEKNLSSLPISDHPFIQSLNRALNGR